MNFESRTSYIPTIVANFTCIKTFFFSSKIERTQKMKAGFARELKVTAIY